jgi:hypothetical protein
MATPVNVSRTADDVVWSAVNPTVNSAVHSVVDDAVWSAVNSDVDASVGDAVHGALRGET